MEPNIATTFTRSTIGLDSQLIRVEVHISNGLPCFSIVGLAQTSVKESKDRVRSAIINSHFAFPSKRITVNLAPANTPKNGSGFDLAIAIGILVASRQLPLAHPESFEFIGELGLSGELHSIYPILPAIISNKKSKRTLIVAHQNAIDGSLVQNKNLHFTSSILSLCQELKKGELLKTNHFNVEERTNLLSCLRDIKGQAFAKKALLIAACGGHNVLMIGPPGSGKTMLASRLNSLLPPLSLSQALECASLSNFQKSTKSSSLFCPPFRSPHHSASNVSIAGGGNPPLPGEISLAHNGVLFLDELPEFDRRVIESLREPLESGKIIIARSGHRIEYPAKFQLITAMNPCPCGYFGTTKLCSCSSSQINNYQRKLSGPFLDRIDLQLNVTPIDSATLLEPKTNTNEPSSLSLQERVVEARAIQVKRQGKLNQYLNSKEIERYCHLKMSTSKFLIASLKNLELSNRGLHRTLKVARTLADLDARDHISKKDLSLALSFRLRLESIF